MFTNCYANIALGGIFTMKKGRFLFLNTNDSKILLYFDVDGEVCEIKWSNQDYISNKFDEFEAKDADELSEKLKDKELPVYEYHYTGNDGKKHDGYTLDKPFPEASDPSKKAVVAGKVVEVVDNGYKVAITVADKGGNFTIVRGFSVYDVKNQKLYPVSAKKQRLLDMFDVDDFADLKDQYVQFIRQKAGANFYYEM